MYQLSCLLCHATPQSLEANGIYARHGALVAMQDHAMEAHGYTVDDLRAQTREQLPSGELRYTMPDGRAWLSAVPDQQMASLL